MSNENYILRTRGLNTVSDITDSEDYEAGSIVKDLNPGVSKGVNFKVRAGFENAISALPFSATLSSDFIDFGALSPTNPIIRTADLEVYSPSLYGYSIIVYENNNLKSENETIPNTTCDNGNCNNKEAGVWTNALTYGFGYHCDNLVGSDCDKSFLSGSNFYKSFANSARAETPQSVMAGTGAKNKSSRLSYKVNISGSQTSGVYTNTIKYIAVPNF